MIDFRSWANTTYDEDTYVYDQEKFYGRFDEYLITNEKKYTDEIGKFDGKIKFGGANLRLNMEVEESMINKLEIVNRLTTLIEEVKGYEECNECACKSLKYVDTSGAFLWMRTEQGLVKGFYQGMFIAFPVALLVLLV